MDVSSKGIARAALRLGRLGLGRLQHTRVGERVTELAKSNAPGMEAARFAFGLVKDRVRDELERRLLLPEPRDEYGAAPAQAPRAVVTSVDAHPAPAPIQGEDSPSPTPGDARDEGAPAGKASKPRRSPKPEPIETLTMARLLASQGVYDRALRIYDALLRRDADNPTLAAELANVEAQARAAET